MHPRIAILILIVVAIIGSSVLGFMYFVKINSPIIVENAIIIDESEKLYEEVVYEEGTEEYYQNQIDVLLGNLKKEEEERGYVDVSTRRIVIDKINNLSEKLYELLPEKEKELRDKIIRERQKYISTVNEKARQLNN